MVLLDFGSFAVQISPAGGADATLSASTPDFVELWWALAVNGPKCLGKLTVFTMRLLVGLCGHGGLCDKGYAVVWSSSGVTQCC